MLSGCLGLLVPKEDGLTMLNKPSKEIPPSKDVQRFSIRHKSLRLTLYKILVTTEALVVHTDSIFRSPAIPGVLSSH